MLTSTISTGHFAMSQTSTAVEPIPNAPPTCLAIGPVSTTIAAAISSMTTNATVVSSRTGAVFQIGRPSSTS